MNMRTLSRRNHAGMYLEKNSSATPEANTRTVKLPPHTGIVTRAVAKSAVKSLLDTKTKP